MSEAVMFAAGDIHLEGLLALSGNAEHALAVVLCHPHPLYGGDMYNNVVMALAEALQQHDITTLQFNFRGTGRSTGTHGNGVTERQDVSAAIDYLLSRCTPARLAVVGYSFGAAVGVTAGASDARVHALVGVGLPVTRLDASALQATPKPTLLVLGDADNFCPVDAMQAFVQRCTPPPAVQILPGADHFFWGYEQEVAHTVLPFLRTLLSAV